MKALLRRSAHVDDPFTSISPFAVGAEGPFGPMTATGYAVDTVTPRFISGELRDDDRNDYSVQDLNMSARIMQGVDAEFRHRDEHGRTFQRL